MMHCVSLCVISFNNTTFSVLHDHQQSADQVCLQREEQELSQGHLEGEEERDQVNIHGNLA